MKDPEQEEIAMAEILGAFPAQPFPKQKITAFYKLAVLMVTFMMVLLPVIYVGLIGLFGYGVYYHISSNHTVMDGNEAFAALLLYFGPAVVGVVAVIFMIKPLFVRHPKGPEQYVLEPGSEPKLEAFVNQVADAVGASRPAVIELNTDVNAAAGLRRGVLRKELKLIVGAPLLAGLTLPHFGGVLAHEFGHFAQGAGMRLTYVIRSVNAWFARVVYERDVMDEWLMRTAGGIDIRIGIVFYAASLMVWLTRRVLWMLMMLGHTISCFALRQMEYDADRCEVLFAGSEAFAGTSRSMLTLNLGAQQATGLLQETWRQGRLSDNYPEFVVHHSEKIPAEIMETVVATQEEAKTGWFDTHPSDRDRIAAARAMNEEGAFHLEVPASVLLSDPDRIFETLSLSFYRSVGLDVTEANLISNALLEGQEKRMEEEMIAVKRFFGEQASTDAPVFITEAILNEERAAMDPEAWAVQHQQQYKALASDFDAIDKLRGRYQMLSLATAFCQAGLDQKPSTYELKKWDRKHIKEALDTVTAERGKADSSLIGFRVSARGAIAYGLKQADPEEAETIADLVRVQVALEGIWPDLLQIKTFLLRGGALLQCASGQITETHHSRIRSYSDQLRKLCSELKPALEAVPYPFEHVEENPSLWSLVDTHMDQGLDRMIRPFALAESLVDQLERVYMRSLGTLARVAAQHLPEGKLEEGQRPEQGGEAPTEPVF